MHDRHNLTNPVSYVVPKASVNVLRGKLYLLANLPKKDGEPGLKPQRIPLRLNDTPADHRIADKRRVLLQKQIDRGVFDWDDWVDRQVVTTTWRDAINALYRKRVVNGRTGENTWEVNYMGRLRQATMTKEFSSKSIVEFISKWDRGQCSYKEVFYLLQDMCQLTGVKFPELPVPTYSTAQLKQVPEDIDIIEAIRQTADEFQWHLGMMATYGLRPHETVNCKFIDDQHRLQVDEETKRGYRIVIPVPIDWVDLFNLRNERRRKGPGLNQWMHAERIKIPIDWTPYALRHAFAGRLWRFGGNELDIYTAARLMGHSVKEHSKTYRQFIDPILIAEKAEQALQQKLASVASSVAAQL